MEQPQIPGSTTAVCETEGMFRNLISPVCDSTVQNLYETGDGDTRLEQKLPMERIIRILHLFTTLRSYQNPNPLIFANITMPSDFYVQPSKLLAPRNRVIRLDTSETIVTRFQEHLLSYSPKKQIFLVYSRNSTGQFNKAQRQNQLLAVTILHVPCCLCIQYRDCGSINTPPSRTFQLPRL